MLLDLATVALGLAVASGSAAAVFRLKPGATPPPWWLASAHGGVAAAGYAVLVAALPRLHGGEASGTSSFDTYAAVLLGLTLAVGLVMLLRHLRRSPVVVALVGLHATLAISGFVVLLVYIALA